MRKKILLVTRPIAPPWDEASKNFAYYLAKNTPAFELTLLTKGIISDFPDHIRQQPIYTSNHLDWSQRLKLLKVWKMKNSFDIIHFMLTPTKLNSFAFKTFFKSKTARTIQTVATLREDLFKDSELKKILFADLIITYSDYAKNKLASLGLANVERIYPGIDLEYYKPAEKSERLISTFKFQLSDFIATYPGEYARLGCTDDIVDMIISFSNIWKEKNIKFIFACRVKNAVDKKKKEEIIEKLKNTNTLSNVVFTDTISDMAALYNLSDVIIFPVRDMNGKFDVPLAAIEPMACEKPVIVSDLPILSEFAKPEHSVIIERGNVEQLKDSILDFYNNPEKRDLLGKKARNFVEENFDIKKVAEKYQKIYNLL